MNFSRNKEINNLTFKQVWEILRDRPKNISVVYLGSCENLKVEWNPATRRLTTRPFDTICGIEFDEPICSFWEQLDECVLFNSEWAVFGSETDLKKIESILEKNK